MKYDNYREVTMTDGDVEHPELVSFRNALLHRLLQG